MSDTAKHGAFYLGDNSKLYQPQQAQNFEIIFPTAIATLLKYGKSDVEGDTAYLSNIDETLRYSCTSTDVPHYKTNKVSIDRGNTKVHYAGTYEWDNLTLEFTDFIGNHCKDAIYAWRQLNGNPGDDTVAYLDDSEDAVPYKQDFTLIEYTPNWKIVRTWNIHGAFITDVKEDKYSYKNKNQTKSISVTFSLDYAEPSTDTAEV